MEKEKKIGLFQTFNKTANKIEWSLTRVLQFLVLGYWMYFDRYFLDMMMKINGEMKITVNFIVINLIFLIAAFMPKYLKDLIDLKDKIDLTKK